MLSAKSLGTEKSISIDNDFAMTLKPLSGNSNIIFGANETLLVNRYYGQFTRPFQTHAFSVKLGDKLFDLPVTVPTITYLATQINNGDLMLSYVRDNAVYANFNHDFEEGEYFTILGTFPISTGGGLVNRLISFLHSLRLGVLGC